MRTLCPIVPVLACVAAISGHARAQTPDAYYMHVGNYPVAETSWSNDAQGVDHDDNNWYITTTHDLWRVPVGLDLRTVTASSPGVIRREVATRYPPLAAYDHLGDPDVFRYQGTDYLVVPMEDEDATCNGGVGGAALAFFRITPTDFFYVTHRQVPILCNDAGWVAINSQGGIVMSQQHVGAPPGSPAVTQRGLHFFTLDWNQLHNADSASSLTFTHMQQLTDESGNRLEMVTMQGGEYAPGDNLLYLVSGFYDDSGGREEREGIHVIDTSTWQRVEHSTRGFGHFDFYYDPGFPTYEEPEGLTIWDLDDGRSPGVRGQLHVFVSDNDADAGDIDFKHYSYIIRADRNSGVSCQTGSPSCPFHTVQAAVALAWNGAEVRARAGAYSGPLTISKRIRVSAEGGVVRIGN
ncbi:MAG: hypothetical protein SFY69_05910 [Planctomycetota bacterium]|nr:hypothetical protein [Planctomycetota bacterium]